MKELKSDETFQLIEEMIDNIEKVVIGKRETIKLTIMALLAGGHVLLEDIPGVGKTMLVRAIAKSVGAVFKRIQFTPDLLPSDLTGMSIYNQKESQFEFRPGPLMGNIVLADEINRTSPKTQSALLEGMAEGHITVDGETRNLPDPFFVLATQNPIEYEGTYTLPEAQLDRFLMKLSIGYPSPEDELEILSRMIGKEPVNEIEAVMTMDQLKDLIKQVETIYVSESIKKYIVSIVTATRNHPLIRLGISPRGTLGILKAGQACALLEQRDFIVPDDVKKIAPYVMGHRIVLNPEASYSRTRIEDIITEIIEQVKIPVSARDSVK
ncbi:AAA domain-containing protein [Terrilactibacillus sp. BCM23-1]|uniref:AAA domain-containing protein n=1 Tax=Terrilactibacillus tamarindi TaxID=2599694 RepID=A0A6N8CU62_9BACI|nr:MoxR family ATPase [Terrilactibacillus tamarindi]MTT31596.1 AAA domain-containing protein [Terrilactibacillus tamarindi]